MQTYEIYDSGERNVITVVYKLLGAGMIFGFIASRPKKFQKLLLGLAFSDSACPKYHLQCSVSRHMIVL